MKYSFFTILCLFIFPVIAAGQCPKNSDALYDRDKLLEKFEAALKASIPKYAQAPWDGFFVYDLTEPTNKYISTEAGKAGNCINFADRRIYHFSPVEFEASLSHIAILENGNLKIFKSLNCVNGENSLSEVIKYVEKRLPSANRNEVLTRLKNYRTYGFYRTIDAYRVVCNFDIPRPENSDKLYNRDNVLGRFAEELINSVSEKAEEQLPRFLVEESRAKGFFVYDLTEPANKQTSLLERVEFKNNHIYHFAFIDLPFSFSNIAVLEEGKLKIFKSINCPGKGDSLNDVIGYVNQKLKNDKNKNEVIKRIKNYRAYGVYTSFNNLTAPQCEEAVKVKN